MTQKQLIECVAEIRNKMKKVITFLLCIISITAYTQTTQIVGGSGGTGVIDSTRLEGNDILIYKQNGIEVGRDTINFVSVKWTSERVNDATSSIFADSTITQVVNNTIDTVFFRQPSDDDIRCVCNATTGSVLIKTGLGTNLEINGDDTYTLLPGDNVCFFASTLGAATMNYWPFTNGSQFGNQRIYYTTDNFATTIPTVPSPKLNDWGYEVQLNTWYKHNGTSFVAVQVGGPFGFAGVSNIVSGTPQTTFGTWDSRYNSVLLMQPPASNIFTVNNPAVLNSGSVMGSSGSIYAVRFESFMDDCTVSWDTCFVDEYYNQLEDFYLPINTYKVYHFLLEANDNGLYKFVLQNKLPKTTLYTTTNNFSTVTPSLPTPTVNDWGHNVKTGAIHKYDGNDWNDQIILDNHVTASQIYTVTGMTLSGWAAANYARAQLNVNSTGDVTINNTTSTLSGQETGETYSIILIGNASKHKVNWGNEFKYANGNQFTTDTLCINCQREYLFKKEVLVGGAALVPIDVDVFNMSEADWRAGYTGMWRQDDNIGMQAGTGPGGNVTNMYIDGNFLEIITSQDGWDTGDKFGRITTEAGGVELEGRQAGNGAAFHELKVGTVDSLIQISGERANVTYNYNLPYNSPSITSNIRSVPVWTGNGTTAVPSFEQDKASDGVWTPTVTSAVADTILNVYPGFYSRHDSIVSFSCRIHVGLRGGAGSSSQSYDISLPIASNLAGDHDVLATAQFADYGAVAIGGNAESGLLRAIGGAASDKIEVRGVFAILDNTHAIRTFVYPANRYILTLTGQYIVK